MDDESLLILDTDVSLLITKFWDNSEEVFENPYASIEEPVWE